MQWEFAWKVFACGLAFFLVSLVWPEAMAPEVYGHAAYDVPAEVWSMAFMASSMLVIYGLHINGRMPRLTPILRMIGYGMLLFLFVYLVVSAFAAPSGAVVVVFGGFFFVPTIVRHLVMNVRLFLIRWRPNARRL